MSLIKKGAWAIRSVCVNAEQVLSDEGFRRLIVSDKFLEIFPAGIRFHVNQSTGKSAVLESRSQIFFADVITRDDELTLKLSRPAFAETVFLNAVFQGAPAQAAFV